jgi:hypothetical protein
MPKDFNLNIEEMQASRSFLHQIKEEDEKDGLSYKNTMKFRLIQHRTDFNPQQQHIDT